MLFCLAQEPSRPNQKGSTLNASNPSPSTSTESFDVSQAEFILELSGVSKSFDSGGHSLSILRQADLSVQLGETVAITGPSGSGKSTLLSLMAGLDRLTSGEIRYAGTPIHNWDEEQLAIWRRKEVGFVFQNFRLIPSFTALENIALPLEISGVDAQQAEARAEELLAALGIAERRHHFPHQLSGGEQQRVAIGRAYAHKPHIIFADEPTGNLDTDTSKQVLDLLLEMNQAHNTTMLLVTHDPELARVLQRQIAVRDGQCVEL